MYYYKQYNLACFFTDKSKMAESRKQPHTVKVSYACTIRVDTGLG